MHQYTVELRTDRGTIKTVSVMADSHNKARELAQRQHGLLVLSTELAIK